MALSAKNVTVTEQCTVSPPPNSAPTTSLPLTFFDIPWLLFPPGRPLFFYEFPHPISRFKHHILPKLKHSLSLTLQHFFPLAGALTTPPPPAGPEISYVDSDSVPFTVAESDGDFRSLCGYHSRDAREFHSLVPELPLLNRMRGLALLAIQITVFSDAGFCIGLAYRHVVADGRTLDHFMKFWASVSGFGWDLSVLGKLLPCFDRSLINDPIGVKDTFLKEWRELKSFENKLREPADIVRGTFVVSCGDMDRIKQHISCKWKKQNQTEPLLLSPYVITCALIWVCLMNARTTNHEIAGDENHCFGFIAGGITRLDYEVPRNYFGNCVAFARCGATRGELLGEEGLVAAAKAIGDEIKALNGEVLGKARGWILDWEGMFGSELHVTVSGSPKLDLYGLDFGWGRPRKIEDISIEGSGGVSLVGSRDAEGGIEVGLALSRRQMDAFRSAFAKALSHSVPS